MKTLQLEFAVNPLTLAHLEFLDPSAIHYPGPIPVDEILKEHPLGLR